jgi:hypothetical protein
MLWGQERREQPTEVLGVRLPKDIKRKVLNLPNSTEQVRAAILKLVSDSENVIPFPNSDRTLPD